MSTPPGKPRIPAPISRLAEAENLEHICLVATDVDGTLTRAGKLDAAALDAPVDGIVVPVDASLTAVNVNEAHIEDTVARNEPMNVRLRIDAPGDPANVRFLQVLQAADAGVAIGTPTLIQSTDGAWQGAQLGSTVVLFAVELGRSFSNLSVSYTHLTLPTNREV